MALVYRRRLAARPYGPLWWQTTLAGQIANAEFFGVLATGGQIKAWSGAEWVARPVKVWLGAAWVQKPLKRWTGTEWVLT